MEKNDLYSEMVRANSRTYFMNIRQATNGSKYITVTESRKNKEGEFQTSKVMIFKEDIKPFHEGLTRLLEHYGELQPTWSLVYWTKSILGY